VPRYLSASCGTCVLYSADEPQIAHMDTDVERVVERIGRGNEFRELLIHA